jgi:HEAT repeat protein
VQHLGKALKDSNPEVRASAALALSCVGASANPTQETFRNLQEMLKDSVWKVRFAACKAIGSFGEKAHKYIPDLLKVLVHGTVERTQVAMVLVHLGIKANQGKYLLVTRGRGRRSTNRYSTSTSYKVWQSSSKSSCLWTKRCGYSKHPIAQSRYHY